MNNDNLRRNHQRHALGPQDIVYSEDIDTLFANDFDDRWCVHMLCKRGQIDVVFNARRMSMQRGDLLVSTRPDLLTQAALVGPDCQVEMIVAPLAFLNAQLPLNNFGIGGSIQLFSNPIITVDDTMASTISADFRAIRNRLPDTAHLFYDEVMGHLCGVMMNDIFDAHSRYANISDETQYPVTLVNRLTSLLTPDNIRRDRSVAYYASLLHVTPKYLSNTIRRLTGQSVTSLINRQAVPMLKDYLHNTHLTLQQIADLMNFYSVSHLCVFAEKHLGISPTRFRKNLQPK